MHRALCLLLLVAIVLWRSTFIASAINPHGVDIEDNEFAEFEEFEDEEFIEDTAPDEKIGERKVHVDTQSTEADIADDDDVTVDDEDDEFDHFEDEDEFVGFDPERPSKGKGQEKLPDLKITSVPLHLRTNWDSFYMEMLMLAGLGVYFLNFLAGKTKNNRLAQAWLSSHKELLESNFSVVGDDGQTKDVQSGILMKESENMYTLWCSGRTCCEGMLVTLKLLKRQDLVSTIARFFKPASDQVIVKVTMDDVDMDAFIFCLATKKGITKLQKDMADLSLYSPEKKSSDKLGIPKSFQLLSEIGEATSAILDRQVVAALNKYESNVEYIHFSDQFSGAKQTDDTQSTKAPETSKVLIFCFNVSGRGTSQPRDIEALRPLFQMVFHCMEKVKRIKLGREAKTKAEKKRQKVEETYMKATHAQRQEAAQQRREDKVKAEKERMMNEEDPDKQRKWEDRENRREMKRKQPKVKMMKVKAM